MKWKIYSSVGIVVLIISVALILLHPWTKFGKDEKKTSASSTSAVLTTEADWNQYSSKTNIDLASSPGSFSIDNKGLSAVSGGSFSYSSCAGPPQDPTLIHDGNDATGMSLGCVGNYAEWDFGETKTIAQVRTLAIEVDTDFLTTPELSVQYWNGSTWTELYVATNMSYAWETHNISPTVEGSKIRYVHQMSPPGSPNEAIDFMETTASASAVGILTSGATQITNTNLYEWQTFTPTYTEPANTDISFKFRTSTNSTDWNAWTASQTVASGNPLDITSLVTSKTGEPGEETFYKYIQVETTLTSTDGVSTPTLSDYTIGYHTNVKPNQPTTQSVTIGS